ncbi:MAG TPA: hypothetical protein VF796_27950 [Humisphaera sp.]
MARRSFVTRRSFMTTPFRAASAAVLLLAAAALTGGCGSATPGETVSKFTKGEDPGSLVTVAKPGTYALYYTTDTTPQVRTPVKAGDKVGFEVQGKAVTAVAGEYRKPLDKDVYKAYWKRVKDK